MRGHIAGVAVFFFFAFAHVVAACGSDDSGSGSSSGGRDAATDGPGGGGDATPPGNDGGQGDATTDGGIVPNALRVVGPHERSCAIAPNGHAKCWGLNAYGSLGLGDTEVRGNETTDMGAMLPLLDVGAGRTVKDVAGGFFHACVLRDDGAVKCHGFAQAGALGYGDLVDRGGVLGDVGDGTPNVALGTGRTARALSAANTTTCVILDDGKVKCWGANGSGQLGIGDKQSRGTQTGEMGDALPAVDLGVGRTAIAIASGFTHQCAILDDGRVKCWGDNSNLALGISGGNRGDGVGAMGDLLPAVDLGAGRKAKAISTRSSTTCALLDDGSVKCWGQNLYGQLGRGDSQAHPASEGHAAIALGTGRTAKAIAVGTFHACAILDDDRVKCWGGAPSGELGRGSTDNLGDAPNEMGDALPYVDFGAVQTVKSIAAGYQHTCVVLTDDKIKCWGSNDAAELGLGVGPSDARGDAPNEMGAALPAVDVGPL